MKFFIDKLNVYQTHSQKLPLLGENGFVRVDLETGFVDLDNVAVKRMKLEGSFSTSLLVRCNGHTVSVEGNPSRINRLDNLVGFYKIAECIEVYNHILSTFGLPPFTPYKQIRYLTGRNGKNTRITDGAVITHIDFTRNHSVCTGNEQTFLKGISTQSINRSIAPYLYPNECTVEWYSKNVQGQGSSFRYVKMYAKASELLENYKKRTRKLSDSEKQYFDRLLDYCVEQGVVREEHSFKSKFLAHNKLNYYGEVKESDFIPYLSCIDDSMKCIEVTKMNPETISQTLLEEGIVKSRYAANATELWYRKWLYGEEIDRSRENRQYYVHKKRLKQLGIDISIKLDISRAPIRLKPVQVIEVKPLEIPAWYQMPVVNPASNVVNLIKAA